VLWFIGRLLSPNVAERVGAFVLLVVLMIGSAVLL
jgi:hypothetical protein